MMIQEDASAGQNVLGAYYAVKTEFATIILLERRQVVDPGPVGVVDIQALSYKEDPMMYRGEHVFSSVGIKVDKLFISFKGKLSTGSKK